MQISGNVELIQHTNHLLTTIALPGKTRIRGESRGEVILSDATTEGKDAMNQKWRTSDSLGQGFLSEYLQSDAGHVD